MAPLAQPWKLQPNILSQETLHNGTEASQTIHSFIDSLSTRTVIFPKWGHSPYWPGWHPFPYICFPWPRSYLHGMSHWIPILSFLLCFPTLTPINPSLSTWWDSWHVCEQRWIRQFDNFKQTLSHKYSLNPHHRTSSRAPQKHGTFTSFGHDGEGPGWHKSKQMMATVALQWEGLYRVDIISSIKKLQPINSPNLTNSNHQFKSLFILTFVISTLLWKHFNGYDIKPFYTG